MTKTPEELELMAEAGRLLASVFTHLDGLALLGLSAMQVNDLVDAYIVQDLKARPASKGQYGYGYALNASRNDVVCHGVPAADDILRDGDIVNFDITLEKGGYIADSSKTYLVGQVHPAARRLVQTSYQAMWKGIRAVRPGARLGDIGHAIERHAKRNGFRACGQLGFGVWFEHKSSSFRSGSAGRVAPFQASATPKWAICAKPLTGRGGFRP